MRRRSPSGRLIRADTVAALRFCWAGDPVRLVDHEGVAGLELVEHGTQLRPFAAGAGGFHHDLAAVRARQRVELGLVVLAAGGDAAVPAMG